ncbi:MAG TPA: hypothetical protein DCG06_00625 [Deltaproteobacteria bacterium]|nr:hypothetical protein [Deltaproteobacteria bacterium]
MDVLACLRDQCVQHPEDLLGEAQQAIADGQSVGDRRRFPARTARTQPTGCFFVSRAYPRLAVGVDILESVIERKFLHRNLVQFQQLPQQALACLRGNDANLEHHQNVGEVGEAASLVQNRSVRNFESVGRFAQFRGRTFAQPTAFALPLCGSH